MKPRTRAAIGVGMLLVGTALLGLLGRIARRAVRRTGDNYQNGLFHYSGRRHRRAAPRTGRRISGGRGRMRNAAELRGRGAQSAGRRGVHRVRLSAGAAARRRAIRRGLYLRHREMAAVHHRIANAGTLGHAVRRIPRTAGRSARRAGRAAADLPRRPRAGGLFGNLRRHQRNLRRGLGRRSTI